MKKYIAIVKMMFQNQLQYMWNVALSSLHFLIIIFIFTNLWTYMYKEGDGLIAGYSISQMVWYLIITELIIIGTSTSMSKTGIAADVKSGQIAYMLNKPLDYIFYQFSNYIGEILVKLIVFIPIGISLGLIMIGKLDSFNVIYLHFMIVSFCFGACINFLMRMIIGLLAFWTEDTSPFYWIYSKFILVFGVFFPADIFPKGISEFVKSSPVAAITYGPARNVISFDFNEFIYIICIQIIYLLLTTAFVFWVYNKGVRKLNVNGG